MKKNVIALAVAAAMVPAFATAADSKVSGFADVLYTNNSDANISVFTANAEVDYAAKLSDIVSVRVDTDLALAKNGGTNYAGVTGGPADSAVIEQAYFAANVAEGVTLIGGVFNNPIGMQAQDVIDRHAITASTMTYDVLDGQTALYGNNIAGVAVAGDLGPVTVTGAVLNDIGLAALDKHSVALVVNATPVAGLDVELGYVTQEASAGNVTDLNATYKNAGLTLGLEYMTAENILDTGIAVMANYMFTPAVGATVQYSSTDGDTAVYGNDADTRTSVAGVWNVADNLSTYLEYTTDDKGDSTSSTDMVNLRFVAKF